MPPRTPFSAGPSPEREHRLLRMGAEGPKPAETARLSETDMPPERRAEVRMQSADQLASAYERNLQNEWSQFLSRFNASPAGPGRQNYVNASNAELARRCQTYPGYPPYQIDMSTGTPRLLKQAAAPSVAGPEQYTAALQSEWQSFQARYFQMSPQNKLAYVNASNAVLAQRARTIPGYPPYQIDMRSGAPQLVPANAPPGPPPSGPRPGPVSPPSAPPGLRPGPRVQPPSAPAPRPPPGPVDTDPERMEARQKLNAHQGFVRSTDASIQAAVGLDTATNLQVALYAINAENNDRRGIAYLVAKLPPDDPARQRFDARKATLDARQSQFNGLFMKTQDEGVRAFARYEPLMTETDRAINTARMATGPVKAEAMRAALGKIIAEEALRPTVADSIRRLGQGDAPLKFNVRAEHLARYHDEMEGKRANPFDEHEAGMAYSRYSDTQVRFTEGSVDNALRSGLEDVTGGLRNVETALKAIADEEQTHATVLRPLFAKILPNNPLNRQLSDRVKVLAAHRQEVTAIRTMLETRRPVSLQPYVEASADLTRQFATVPDDYVQKYGPNLSEQVQYVRAKHVELRRNWGPMLYPDKAAALSRLLSLRTYLEQDAAARKPPPLDRPPLTPRPRPVPPPELPKPPVAPARPEAPAPNPDDAAIRALNEDPAIRGKLEVRRQPDGTVLVKLTGVSGRQEGYVNYFLQGVAGVRSRSGRETVFGSGCDVTGLLAGLKTALANPSALPTPQTDKVQEFVTPETLANPSAVADGIATALSPLLPGPTVGAIAAHRYPGANASGPAAIDIRVNRSVERFTLTVSDGRVTLTNPRLTITLPARPGMTTLEMARGMLGQIPAALMLGAIESAVSLVKIRNKNVGAELSLFGRSVLQADGRTFNFSVRNGNYIMERGDGTQTLIEQRTPPDVFAITAAVQRAETPAPRFNAPSAVPPERSPEQHDARLRAAGFEKADEQTNVLSLDKLAIPRAVLLQMCVDMGIPPVETPRLRVTRDPSGYISAEVAGVREHLVGGDKYRGLYGPTQALAAATTPAAVTAALQAFKQVALAIQPVFSANPRTNAVMAEIFNRTDWTPADGRADLLRVDRPAKDGQPAYTLLASLNPKGEVASVTKLVDGMPIRGFNGISGAPKPLSPETLRAAESAAAGAGPETLLEGRSAMLMRSGFRKLDGRTYARSLAGADIPPAGIARIMRGAPPGSSGSPEVRLIAQNDGSLRAAVTTDRGVVIPMAGISRQIDDALPFLARAPDRDYVDAALFSINNAIKDLAGRA
jgi:hypothetical protein